MVCNIYVSAYDGAKFVSTVTNVPGVSMYVLCIFFVCFCDNKEFAIQIRILNSRFMTLHKY